MPEPLLSRQIDLLEFLTSGAAIFPDVSETKRLHGFDRDRLHLEARFSYEKRMHKIAKTLPTTMDFLVDPSTAVTRAFVEEFPPAAIGHIDNARQFLEFLCRRRETETDLPGYLPDIAACELAYAQVRSGARATPAAVGTQGWPGTIRRHPKAVLVRCRYDIRSIFEADSPNVSPPMRDTRLAFAIPQGATEPQVLQLAPIAFQWLSELTDWVDASARDAASASQDLIEDFASRGLIEVHP